MLAEHTPEAWSAALLVAGLCSVQRCLLQGVHHVQASCRAAHHTAGRAPWLLAPHCTSCCRVRTFHEPVAAAICGWIPEHMHETSRMKLLYEDIQKLPVSRIARIAAWLTRQVESLISEPCAEPREAEQEVGWTGQVASQAACHHDT